MKVHRFSLEGEDPPRLELRWENSQINVHLDGAQVATLDGFRGLKRGWSTTLEGGARLEVRTIRRVLFPELSILRDGYHVPSSPAHPDKMLRSSSNAILFLAAFFLVTALVPKSEYAWLDIVFSVCYLVGGLLLRKRRRLGAAVVAIPLFIRLDILLLAVFVQPLDRTWIVELLLSLLFATFVIRSYQAAQDSRNQAASRVSASAG